MQCAFSTLKNYYINEVDAMDDVLLKAVLETDADSVVVIGKNHKVLAFNQTIKDVLRHYHNRDIAEGDPYYPDFVIENMQPVYLEAYERAINGKPFHIQSLTKNEGYSAWFDYTMQPIFNDTEVLGVVLKAKNISAEKEAEAKIIDLADKLKVVLDHTGESITILDMEGKIMSVNQKATFEIWRNTNSETYIGKQFADYIPDKENPFYEYFPMALKGETTMIEIAYENFSGDTIWYQTRFSPVLDSTNTQVGVAIFAIDITDTKKTREQLEGRERLLKLFVEHSPAALAMFDRDMRFLMVSQRWLDDYKLHGVEIIGKTLYEIFPDISQRWKDIHHSCLQGVIEKNNEDEYVRQDGTVDWMKWEIHPWQDASGGIGGCMMFTERITEAKLAREEISKRESELTTFFNEANNAACLLDTDKRYVLISNKFAEKHRRLTGKEPAVGDLYFQDFPKEKMEERHAILDRVMQGGKESTIDVEHLIDGKTLYYKTAFSPVISNDKVTGVAIYATDLTESKEAELKLQKANHDIEERVKELTCLYTISRLANDTSKTMNDVLEAAVRIIPAAYQYPEITSAQITYHDKTFRSKDFLQSEWSQSAPLTIDNEVVGTLEVYYSKEMPQEYEGPFLKEERFLIDSIAEGLSAAAMKRHAEAELRESEEKFRSVVEQSLVGVYIFAKGKFTYVNPGFEKITGYSKDQLLGEITLEKLVHSDDLRKVVWNHLSQRENRHATNQFIFRTIRSDGELLHLEAFVTSITINNAPATLGTLVDITNRIQEEKRIGKAVNEAQENERMKIGMELHDNVKQLLVASMINIDLVKEKLNDQNAALEILDNLSTHTQEAITELRRLSHELAPVMDTGETLPEKIKSLIKTMNRDNKLGVTFKFENTKRVLKSDIQITFYRIIQEQFSNIMKYAKATSVIIQIKYGKSEVSLLIKDDGIGFDIKPIKKGIGLKNIVRRATALDGKATIMSSPGQGCEVRVRIPID